MEVCYMFNMREMFQLTGKTVAVTGPTGYLGPIFIEACAQMGADIAAIGRPQSEEKLSALCERIKTTYHVEAKHYAFDILNEESVEACAQSIKKDFGRIDGLINCAGVNCHGSVAEYTIEDYERLMTINICGTFNVSKHFGAIMCNDKKGSIVNVASFGGTIVTLPPRTMSGYCTSKAGVMHLTRALAGEFGEHNVRVNSISPGYLEHGMSNVKNFKILNDSSIFEDTLKHTPMHRVGSPSELAGAVIYLLSDASTFTTGIDIVVDGGFVIW